jgi:hypothetical protein
VLLLLLLLLLLCICLLQRGVHHGAPPRGPHDERTGTGWHL